jgi:hypothetical protein
MVGLFIVGAVTLLVADTSDVATEQMPSDLANALKLVLGMGLLALRFANGRSD